VVAVLLFIGFYVLAFGIAAALLGTVYLQVVGGHIFPKFALIAIVLAGIVIWSVIPRPDRFEPPGPRLTEEEQPRLFAVVRDIAARTGQEMPSEIYLVADVNAFVTQRGGVMGFFSRRVMGIGLPLLTLLTVSELSAVLAHEFGHYHGGDTKLGPWIYKTRAAIGRTIVSLAEGGSTVVRAPFEWYGNFFLKVTHSISRAQEFAADALAARVVGPGPLVSGLKTVHGGAAAYGAFIREEVAPIVSAGFRPPLVEGFKTFVDGKHIKASLARLVSEELEGGESDAFDTHPPLARRVEALLALGLEEREHDDRRAIELLDAAEELEAALVREGESGPLEPLSWTKVVRTVYLPQWQKTAAKLAKRLEGPTLASLVRSPKQLAKLAEQVGGLDVSSHREIAPQFGAHLAAAAVCATLAGAGWTIKNRVGRPISLRNGDHRLSPFKDFSALASGELEPAELRERLVKCGVSELVVGAETDQAPRVSN
jgi:Zn-dependent protease with chaperone function